MVAAPSPGPDGVRRATIWKCRFRVSRGLNALPKPGGKLVFAKLSGSKAEHGPDCVRFVETQLHGIRHQKQACNDPRSSFVAVDERVIAGNATRISRRQLRRVGLAVRGGIFRSRECGLERALIASA